MSPSEEQLRAALAEGQGPGISADRIIAQAREIRHQRRVRYGSGLAIAAAVAGIGVGGGLLIGGSGNSSTSYKGFAQGPASSSVAQPSAAAGNGAQSASGGVACPASLPQVAAPIRGTGPLFDAPPSAVTLCLYLPDDELVQRGPSRTVLTGSAAINLAGSIDGAPAVQQSTPCPLYRTAAAKTLVMIGQRADGTTLAPVETQVEQNPCNLPITNGTAVRYNWSPPQSLSAFLDQTTATTSGPATPPHENGSPVRS